MKPRVFVVNREIGCELKTPWEGKRRHGLLDDRPRDG